MGTMLEAYHAAVEQSDIESDPNQLEIVHVLDTLLDACKAASQRWWWQKTPDIKGVYLYGTVGVGKTFLMDLFYHNLPDGLGARYHFHAFMQQVDAQLRQRQGQKDPLKALAKELSKKTKILCFDEFIVHDVAYAMILTELFRALFAEGLVLVTTSNTLPEKLYWNGIQRQRFLPTIDLLNSHCQIMTLSARKDYRLDRKPEASAWYQPANADSHQAMEKQFAALSSDGVTQQLRLQGRDVNCLAIAAQGVWFGFDQICNLPRSQLDYLELADRFDQVFVSNIPQMGEKHTSQAVLFVYFIDIMYDYGVRLVLSSEVPVEALCTNSEMQKEFIRTKSRLFEMQSEDYARRHQHHREVRFDL